MEAIMDIEWHNEVAPKPLLAVILFIFGICLALNLENLHLNNRIVVKALWKNLVDSQQETSDQRQGIEELRATLTARDKTISDQGKETKELQATLTARDSTISSLEACTKHLNRQLATSALETLRFSSDARATERQAHNYKEANASLTRLLTYAREQRVIVQNQMQREIETLMHEYDFVAIDHRVALEEQAEGFAQERREAAAKLETQKAEAAQLMKEATAKFEAEKAEAEQRIAELTAKCEEQADFIKQERDAVHESKERIHHSYFRVMAEDRARKCGNCACCRAEGKGESRLAGRGCRPKGR